MDFLFPSRCQLQIDPWLVVGPHVHSIFPVLGFCLLHAYCKSWQHGLLHSLSSYAHMSICAWKILFPWNHLSSLALMIFPFPLLHRFLRADGRGLTKTSYLGLSIANSFTLCILSGCISLCSLPFSKRKTFSGKDWVTLWSMGSFSRIIVVGFSLGLGIVYSQGFGHFCTISCGFHLMKWPLNTIKILVCINLVAV